VEVVIVADRAGAGVLVGGAIADLVHRHPEAVLGVATGSSPEAVYADLARRHASGELSLAKARAFLLDEYVGLPLGHPQAYRTIIAEELEAHVDFGHNAVAGPDVHVDGRAVLQGCLDYEAAIRWAGGVDLQLLGIGTDGHIGFNEPGSSLASRTRLKTLTDQTRRDNARFFSSPDEVPRHVVTQGIGTILDARHLVMLAFGPGKAGAIAAAIEGPVSAMVPASALQLHPHVTVVVDDGAASQLRLADYYRETWAHKPPWQGI
jgi:glucosamine-6-phosphate deaminase